MMTIIHNYNEYINRLLNGETQSVVSGEVSVIRSIESLDFIIPEGKFYVWDNIESLENPVVNLVEVTFDGRSIKINDIQYVNINLVGIAQKIGIKDLEAALKWWNLCFFRNIKGEVTCEACDGEGETWLGTCDDCGGDRVVYTIRHK